MGNVRQWAKIGDEGQSIGNDGHCIMTDNGDNDRQLGITDNGEWHTMGMTDNGIVRQCEMIDNKEW